MGQEYDPADVRSGDTDLLAAEKETSFLFANDEELVTAFSANVGVVRHFIKNPNITVTGVNRNEEGFIVSAMATFPIGMLTVKGAPRSTNAPSAIMSTSYDKDDDYFEEVFAD